MKKNCCEHCGQPLKAEGAPMAPAAGGEGLPDGDFEEDPELLDEVLSEVDGLFDDKLAAKLPKKPAKDDEDELG
jgi:hypothetical protein